MSYPFAEHEFVAIRRGAKVVHAETRPMGQLPFVLRLSCVLIQPHLPKIASATKKRSGFLLRVEQAVVWELGKLIDPAQFGRGKNSGFRPTLDSAAHQFVPVFIGHHIEDALSSW